MWAAVLLFVLGVGLAVAQPGNLGDDDDDGRAAVSSSTSTTAGSGGGSSSTTATTEGDAGSTTTTSVAGGSGDGGSSTTTTPSGGGSGLGQGGAGSVDDGNLANTGASDALLPMGLGLLATAAAGRRLVRR